MIKIPDDVINILKSQMRSPQGSCVIKITFEENIYDRNILGGIIFQNIAGGHYFRLERTNDLKIKFYHFSPGTGTRLAVADISQSIPSLKVMFILVWSPTELSVNVGPMAVANGNLEKSIEETSDKNFKITLDGQVIEVGGPDIEVAGLRILQGGNVILDSTAIESWSETLQAIDILIKANSEDGYMFDVVKSNFAAVALVTGIETYCKRRLQELESEGVELNYKELEQKSNNALTKEKIFAETSNYFQSLERMKEIWKHLVGIKVAEINPSSWLDFKEKLFPHRHVVVHAHSLRSNIEFIDNQEPLFITNEIFKLKSGCESFIKELHKKHLS